MSKENDFLKEWVLTKRATELRDLFLYSSIFKLPPLVLPFGQKPISWNNFLQWSSSKWLYFVLFSGVERQCRISRGKRLICYLMQLNSICQVILFTSSWRDWGIWERMGAVNVFPEVVLREETDLSVLDSWAVLFAVITRRHPDTSFL